MLQSSSRIRVQTWLQWPELLFLPSVSFWPMLSPAGENAAITLFLHLDSFYLEKKATSFYLCWFGLGFFFVLLYHAEYHSLYLSFLLRECCNTKNFNRRIIYWKKDETHKLLTSERSTLLYVYIYKQLGHGAAVSYVIILGVKMAEMLWIYGTASESLSF